MAVFHQKKIMHGNGHQMMTFTADCGPIVHVNVTSQNSACVFVQGCQFTANCYTGMADLEVRTLRDFVKLVKLFS